MNVGYFSVQHRDKSTILDWDLLSSQKVVERKKNVAHVQFRNNLTIKMDGKKRISVIVWE